MALVKIMSRAKRPMRNQFSKFGNNSRCILAYLFLPSLSNESPTPASAEGASCADGTDGWTDGRMDGGSKVSFDFSQI